jgi:hypothetical protein
VIGVSAIPLVLAGMLAVLGAIVQEDPRQDCEACWETIERVGWVVVALLAP